MICQLHLFAIVCFDLAAGEYWRITTWLSEPDDGHERMQKKSENVAHARDGIKLKNLKNSVRLRFYSGSKFATVDGLQDGQTWGGQR